PPPPEPTLFPYTTLFRSRPGLRQTFMRWPWTHLYQHPHSVAMLAVNRTEREGERLFWGRFLQPETRPLTELQAALDRYKHQSTRSEEHTSELQSPCNLVC